MDAEVALKIWEHYPLLVRRARRLGRNHAEAEDLASATVLRAITAKYDGNPNLRPWLYTILKNQFINLVKSPYVVSRDWDDDFSDLADLPSEPDDALLKQVSRFTPQLKKEDADILLLAALGNTCPEMGARLGISLAAAQSRWFRAVRRLRLLVGVEETRRAEKRSIYRGVTPHQGGWRVRLRTSEKGIVGQSGFKTEAEAAMAYNVLAIAHLGERAVLNSVQAAT